MRSENLENVLLCVKWKDLEYVEFVKKYHFLEIKYVRIDKILSIAND